MLPVGSLPGHVYVGTAAWRKTLDQRLLGLKNILRLCAVWLARLAAEVGRGGSTLAAAARIGGAYGSDVFGPWAHARSFYFDKLEKINSTKVAHHEGPSSSQGHGQIWQRLQGFVDLALHTSEC